MSKEKKLKKSKRKHADDDDENKKERKRAKKQEKKALLQQLPKTNEDGVAFTKLQIRRMLKRVKRGLPPIPTAAEQEELKRQEATLRKEEEAELAGLADTIKGSDNGEEEDGSDGENSGGGDDDEVGESSAVVADAVETPAPSASETRSPAHSRKRRSKSVPDDYVCQACQNQHEPSHWIYDCPSKITRKGSNHVSKKLRGIHAPDERKVFLSGLPFDMKKRDVESLFKDCGNIVQVKLLTFPDTGRCKGQAYITFDSEASAKKARQLSGTTIPAATSDDKKKKKNAKESPNKRKELKLKVTKVLNRTQTKHKQAV